MARFEATIEGYRAAVESAVVVPRPTRVFQQVVGRSPEQMLTGILSGKMPPPFEPIGPGSRRGRMPCSAILTPKGRLVAIMRVARIEDGESGALLLDVPEAAAKGAGEHLRRFLPPRLARLTSPEPLLGAVTIVGPAASSLLSEEIRPASVGSVALDTVALDTMVEGDLWYIDDGTALGVRLVRSGMVTPPAFDVIAEVGTIESLEQRLRDKAVPTSDAELWHTLRVERGRPAFGAELDQDTLPPEAGIQDRCIDFAKGCFTGQEVIVRIRDRGHVNRRLRGLLLGDVSPPDPGAQLFDAGGHAVGDIRSAIRSPRFGQTIALGYVRREVEPPSILTLGATAESEVAVRALDDSGWVLVAGDPSLYPGDAPLRLP